MKLARSGAGMIAALTLLGCITVNVYFPAPEVRQAAEEIVEETWGGAAPLPPPAEGESRLPGEGGGYAWSLVRAAHAADVDINVSTAAIRALKDRMKTRADQLKPHLSAGRVGIAQSGMLSVRGLEGLTLKDQATVRRLVDAENADRLALYREIAKANNFGEERVADVQRIFADTWIQKAEKGWWVEQGGWKRK
ncbi:MAG TPA: DUF1318 domain-containing protein [Terriglobales bacterium]|nr:DUF1318 domain-containing protein [Terriglobales bacterium]